MKKIIVDDIFIYISHVSANSEVLLKDLSLLKKMLSMSYLLDEVINNFGQSINYCFQNCIYYIN